MLTLLFTGSTAYHVLWATDTHIYDMNLLRRRRPLDTYRNANVVYYDFPMVTALFLERRLTNDNSTYGFCDYLLFALRPIYHLFGKSTRNANGTICSEMVNQDLIDCGYATPWSIDSEAPSPADIERWLKG